MSAQVLNTTPLDMEKSAAAFPPEYDAGDKTPIDLDRLHPSGSRLSMSSTSSIAETIPPSYQDATASGSPFSSSADFHPTLHFQIETSGRSWWSNPWSSALGPIPIFAVDGATTSDVPAGATPAYISLRFTSKSGSSYLIRGDDAAGTPLATTTYRFGPGKPPVFRLVGPGSPSLTIAPAASSGCGSSSSAPAVPLGNADVEFPITSVSLTSRTQLFKTPYGTFSWRYASRAARKAENATSLLVLEKITTVALAGPEGKTEEQRVKIAQLVRNEELRTPGSSASTAGNGGRLQIDLSGWGEESKLDRQKMEQLVVGSCVCMLKKEADRRRTHQNIIIFGGAGS